MVSGAVQFVRGQHRAALNYQSVRSSLMMRCNEKHCMCPSNWQTNLTAVVSGKINIKILNSNLEILNNIEIPNNNSSNQRFI